MKEKTLLFFLVLVCGCSMLVAQNSSESGRQKVILGQVVDTHKEPLAGVSVSIKGTSVMALTDVDGKFLIRSDVSPKTEFIFSFMGMKTLTVPLSQQPEKGLWVLVMEDDALKLEEVLVTGYQNIKKNELTGSIKQLKVEDMIQSAKFSIDQMLQGQTAGMSVITTSGEPSATAKIRIRGTSSITSSKAPLWVLDGIILEDVDPRRTIDYSSLDGEDAAYLIGNAIAGINPQDIEDINVLKDASATALYGVQAANGVIVVTTKKGRQGPPKITYNTSVAVNMRNYYANLYLMNAAERVELSMDIKKAGLALGRPTTDVGWEGLMNAYDTKGPFEDYNKIGVRRDYETALNRMVERNTDWYDMLFRNAVTHNHTVSLTGGNTSTTYYASLGYGDSQGTAMGSASKRYTAALKLTSWLNTKTYVNFQLNGSMNVNDGFHGSVNPDKWARTTARTIPMYYDDGSLFFYKTDYSNANISPDTSPIVMNYLNELAETGQQGKLSSLTAKLDLRWNIWDKLRYEFSGSLVNQSSTSKSWASDRSHYVASIRGYNYNDPAVWHDSQKEQSSSLPYGGIYSYGESSQISYTFRNQLAYEKELVTNHVVSAQAISEIRSVVTEGYSGNAYGWRGDRGQLVSPTVSEYNWESVVQSAGLLTPSITDNIKNYVSWLGFASYSYKGKIMLNGNIRMDGSNQFGDNPQYRFLPVWSVSGRYIATNDAFMKNISWLSYLAIRASYGVQGNVDKNTSPDLVVRLEKYNSNLGFDMSSINMLPNPDLRWEKTRSYNIGMDFSLGDRFISGTVDIYKKMGTDMIMSTQVSQVTGVAIQRINAGDVENTGVEVDLIAYPIRTKKWEFSVNVIYGYNQNKLTRATMISPKTGTEIEALNADKVAGRALIVGESLNTLYAWRFAGLDGATGLPLFYEEGKATSILDPRTGLPSTLAAGGVEVPNYYVYREKADLVKVGVTTPPHTGGINLSLRYKNLRLRASMAYSFGGVKRLPALNSGYYELLDPTFNASKDYVNRWKQPGDELHTNIPALYNSDTYSNLLLKRSIIGGSGNSSVAVSGAKMYDRSDVRVASSDNLRMNSLTLSYMVPASFLKQVRISDAMLSFQVTNLFLIADRAWHGLDPEQSTSANASLPKTFTLTLNVNF